MFPVQKLLRGLILMGGTAALLTTTALAADIPCNAVVTADSAALRAEADDESEVKVSLEAGDALVLLSSEAENGRLPAAWERNDEVYTGYVSAEAVEAQPVAEVSVLTADAVLLEDTDRDSGTLTQLSQGTSVDILGYDRGWFYAEANGTEGFLPLSDVACTVTTTTKLNLRAESNTDSEILEVLPKGTELTPIGAEEDWFQVTYEDQTGYISSDYVTVPEEYIVDDPSTTDGEAVLAFAQQFLGNRYVWGGTSLTNGCDCSGYVMQVYAQFGVSLPHSSAAMRKYGEKVSYSDIQIGDVVCYSGHVGIYAGNGKIINALNKRAGICYTNVNYAPIVTIRRLL